jgi:hypothetical protein
MNKELNKEIMPLEAVSNSAYFREIAYISVIRLESKP